MNTEHAEAPLVLIVDDDPSQRDLLGGFLRRQGHDVECAASGPEALARLAARPVSLMVSDVRMPGMTGLELMRRAREQFPTLPVLMVTAFADIRDAVEAMRDGALNYLQKPVDLDELRAMVAEAVGAPGPEGPEKETGGLCLPAGVIAHSTAMLDALRDAFLVAPFDSRVLLSGESGTGKEVVADLIHAWSPRHGRPMLCVNCAAIPENLLESELFGHERGAFTGAVEARVGRFEEAAGGTLFLDEIAEMPPALQAKLLRVTQDGTFQRLGANRVLQADVRLIAATNRDLEAEVAAGRFREDLYYRLNVIEIRLPPLRDRSADILPLANHFAQRYGGGRPRLSPAVASRLALYDWPGNVRELQNAMERAVLMARGGVILPEHLPRRILDAVGSHLPSTPSAGAAPLQEMEDMLILQTLRDHGYNRTETARTLGISRRALIYKLRRLDEAGHAINP